MASDQFRLKIPINLGSSLTRCISDDKWAEIDRIHIDTWKEANYILSERNLVHKNIAYGIKTDFSPIIEHLEKHYAAMTLIMSAGFPSETDPFPRDDVIIYVDIRADTDVGQQNLNTVTFLVEYFLYDLLLL